MARNTLPSAKARLVIPAPRHGHNAPVARKGDEPAKNRELTIGKCRHILTGNKQATR